MTGLYFLDGNAPLIQKELNRRRGEFEIVSVLKHCLDRPLYAKLMKRGFAWFDTGTHSSMLQASNFVQMTQEKQGLMVACLKKLHLINLGLTRRQLLRLRTAFQSSYGKYLYKC